MYYRYILSFAVTHLVYIVFCKRHTLLIEFSLYSTALLIVCWLKFLLKMQITSVLRLLLISLIGLQEVHQGHGARILAAFLFPGRSHFMMTNAIIRELIKRGHEVTFITPFSLAKENLGKNLTEVVIPQYDFWPHIKKFTNKNSVVEMSDVSSFKFLKLCSQIGVKSSDFAFDQPAVKALINEKNKIGKYDLLLAEEFYNEAALVFGHLYQIPIVTICTFGFSNYMSPRVGVIYPWSYVPHVFMSFTDEMTFINRIKNILMSSADALYRNFVYYPEQDKLLEKHFSQLTGGAPTIRQLNHNISALLLNNYVPIITARPTAFNMIPVGGLHTPFTMACQCLAYLSMLIRAKANGYALSLDYRTITEENLKASLLELLENPKYQTNMKRASSIFRDRPSSAMDTAMYWIDYVIKHRGAPHLITAGSKMPWYQYYLLDVLALGLLLLFLPIYLIHKLLPKGNVQTKKLKKQ